MKTQVCPYVPRSLTKQIEERVDKPDSLYLSTRDDNFIRTRGYLWINSVTGTGWVGIRVPAGQNKRGFLIPTCQRAGAGIVVLVPMYIRAYVRNYLNALIL